MIILLTIIKQHILEIIMIMMIIIMILTILLMIVATHSILRMFITIDTYIAYTYIYIYMIYDML